jgi:hypothetical protein
VVEYIFDEYGREDCEWFPEGATKGEPTAEQEAEILAAIEEGKQALREGKVFDHAAVIAAFERIGKQG